MKYTIYYFTGTGNTERAAGLLRAQLEEAGHTVGLQRIGPDTIPPSTAAEEDECMVIAFPVYSWAPPKIVKQFIRRIPRGRNRGSTAAVLAVDGGGGYQAAAQACRMLSRRGYRVFLSARAGYADNWRQMMNPPDEENAAALNTEGDRAVQAFARSLLGGEPSHYRISRINTVWSWSIGLLFAAVGRRVLAAFFIADESCTSCGLCQRTCPVQAIRMVPAGSVAVIETAGMGTDGADTAADGKTRKRNAAEKKPAEKNAAAGSPRLLPEWRGSCESCNRCINICPVQAVNTSIFRMVAGVVMIAFFILLLLRTFNAAVLPMIPPGLPGLSLFVFLTKAVLILAAHHSAAVLMNPFCRAVGKIPGMRKIMVKSFNKNFRQYLAPGFRPR